jgi:hypothetical protein
MSDFHETRGAFHPSPKPDILADTLGAFVTPTQSSSESAGSRGRRLLSEALRAQDTIVLSISSGSMFPVNQNSALKLPGRRPNNQATESKPAYWSRSLLICGAILESTQGLRDCRWKPHDFDCLRLSNGDNQMKRLFLTFLSTAAVCTVLSATPVAAQETVTGAPVGTAPVTVEGYENSTYTGSSISNSGPAFAFQRSERCHVTRDFYGFQGRMTSVCGP